MIFTTVFSDELVVTGKQITAQEINLFISENFKPHFLHTMHIQLKNSSK